MRKFLFIPLLILFFPILIQYSSGEGDQYLVQTVKSFQFNKTTLYETILQLCQEQKIRVCMEEMNYFSQDSDKRIMTRLISKKYKSETIYEILTDLCKLDPSYIWEYSRNGLLNIIPRSTTLKTYGNSTLAWTMGGFQVETTSCQSILSTSFVYGQQLMNHHIQLDMDKIRKSSDILDRLLTIHLRSLTGRDGLNSIVKSAGSGYLWHLYWKDNEPYIEFIKGY